MVSSDKALMTNPRMNEDTAAVVSKAVVASLTKKFHKIDGASSDALMDGIAKETIKISSVVENVATLGTSLGKLDSVDEKIDLMSDEVDNMAQFMTSMSDLMGRLSPFMQQLPGLVGKGVGELFEESSVVCEKRFQSVTSRINTSFDSLEEGITTNNSILDFFLHG